MQKEMEKTLFVDAFDQPVKGKFLDRLKEIAHKERPICIAWERIHLQQDQSDFAAKMLAMLIARAKEIREDGY